MPTISLEDLIDRSLTFRPAFPHQRSLEPVRDPAGLIVAVLEREQQPIEGLITVSAAEAAEGVYRLTVSIQNGTLLEDASGATRDEALLRSFVSTHTILVLGGGAFLSLADPPEPLAELASECCNMGTWPALVGEPGETDAMLSSPIILDDYPRVSAESPGDLFDCTEIDEMLTLRILTLTEDEKREIAGLDERTRAMLERTSTLAPDQLRELHGSVRRLRPTAFEVDHGSLEP